MAKNSTANTYQDMAQARWSAVRDRADNQLRRVGMTQWNRDEEERKNRLNEFGNYLSSGNYTTENNQKFRDLATQAVADLDEQMKRYGKSSNEYKTLDSYKQYYSNALPNFDRMDVGANVKDYLSYDYENNKFNNWHSEEDYNTQKTYLDQQRAALQSEMDAIEDQTSADYQSLKSWMDQYDMLSEALEERNSYDRQFQDINDYTAYERSTDYKNTVQAKQTLKQAQEDLKNTEAQIKSLEMKFAGYTDLSAIDGADAAAYQQLADLRQQYAQQQKDVLQLTSEVSGMEKWQKDAVNANYYLQYGENADYQQILDDLIDARNKAEEGSEDWAKIDLQIRALAGENENGLNDNGQYDENTLYGRAVMRDFDTEAAQKRMDEIDQELKDLGVSESRFWGGVTNAENNFGVDAAGMVYTDESRAGESDPRVMALRQEKTELTRKMNSAAKFQEKDSAEQAFRNLSEAEHKALQEEGLKHLTQRGKNYYRDIGVSAEQGSGVLDNFQYLDDEYGGGIRDMLIEALGAEALGKDIGYTVDDVLRLYEGDINHIAGMREAQKISDMDSDFLRWNRQVFGVGTAAGLNQFATGMRQAFSDDYIEPNKTAYKAQYTREDLKRYGDEQVANGANVSQMLFDTTQTTANMLPMIAASYLMTKAGLAPVAGEIVGATLMGLSSGGNTYQQALAEGWDKQDAKAYATILGAAEGTMQYLIGGIGALGGVGEEGLLHAAAGINNAAVRFATETGIHILSETTEELAQNRLQRYLDYKLGATDDADWYSWTDDDWYTVVVTALSTGALEAPGVARSTFGAQRLGEQLSGQRIIPSKQEQGGNAVISEIGKAMQSDSALSYTLIAMATDTEMQGTDAYELAERMESGKAPKNAMNLGNLYRDIVNEYVARNGKGGYEDATAAIIGGATKYNALQSAKTELEAADQRASEVRKENPGAEVLNANATELQGYGVNNTKQATEYGAILNKVMSGTDISDAEMDKLLGDSTAAKASRLILEKQNNDPVAVQQLRLSLTRENTEGARDVIKAQIQQFREEKAARKEAEKVSVVQAAMNAANKSEVSRAAANADLQEQVPAATVEAVQKAGADVEAAQSRVKQIERMSFKELAAAKDLGLTEEAIDAGVVQDLQKQMAALNERADKLAAVKLPSQQQRTQLADIREQQAAIKEQLVAAKMSSQSRVEQRAAAVQQTPAAPVQAEAARSNPNVLVLPNGTQVSREEFVQQRVANGQSEANANAAFDELVAQTAPTQKGNIENGQTTDQNGQRNDVGIEADRGEDQKQGDQSEPSADGRREAGVRELRTESGNLAAEVTENASVVDSDHIEVLSQKYKDLPELTSSLKRSGFKKITYVTEGDLLNVLGQSVPALYNDGELYLCLDYKTDGYDYVATAEHERTHLRLDLMRARFGESDTRTMVTSALQTILGEDSYVEAFKRYAERYGPVYLSHGLDVETVGHMINEEMLCDMVGGINNFGTQLGEFQSETEDLLEASKFNVVMQNLVDNPSEDPGTVETGEIPKGSMPYGIPADTLISTQNVDNPSTQPADASQVSKFAFFGLAEALGFKVDQTGAKNKVYYLNDEDAKLGRNGFTQITVDMIKQSPIGDLIRYSVDKGDITPGQAEQEYNLFASIASITDQTHDFYQAMQFMGSTIFTALKANSDTQYGTTYDFPSICTKTQAVINEMSAQMVARGRSLTETEIRQAYNDVFNDGNPVPCPECYVFSRWVGIGGLLDNIRSYQERFGKMSVDEVIAAYNEANKEVLAFAKENGLSKGRAKGSLASLLDKQYKSLEEDIQKRENQGESVPNKDYEIRDKLAARMSTIRSLTWIDEVYFAGKEHKAGNVNPNFSVPINVLYDLNEGETFARDYKEAWAFRTTQGAGYGKAITPYAEAILGEGMLVTANTTKSIKAKAAGALNNPYQTERGRITDSSARGKNLKTARKKELNQLFIGGQRLQSTSDARFDNAVDYLLAALELQSMKGGAQVYTKVPGAVAFFNICKMCTNMSMMPKGGGLDASGNPVDTEVGGMALATMVMLRKQNEYAGSITIGVNDAHIRALMKQEFRDFIIPYHASGGKMSLIEYFRQVQDPDLKGTTIRSSDYTKTQSDKILSDELLRSYFGKTEQEIEDIHKFRDTRLWILTAGKSGTYYSDVLDPYAEGLTESQSNARTVLQELYASMQANGKWNGVQLAKGKVEHQIFPNEFWDTKSTYDTSSVNTQRYLDYCDALGFLHRFSGKTISKGQIIPVTGYDQNGNKVELTDLAYDKDGNIEPFFWKTLTDRRMYGNNGQYLEQPNVDLTNLKAETVATFAAPMGERRYNHRVSMTNAAARAAVSRNSLQGPKEYLPEYGREREVFDRSFANKTLDMRDGEIRNIQITTADDIYFVKADGYMNGEVGLRMPILGNEDKINEIIRRIRSEANRDRRNARRSAVGDRSGRAGYSGGSAGLARPEDAGRNDQLAPDEPGLGSVGYSGDYYGYSSQDELNDAIASGAMIMGEDGSVLGEIQSVENAPAEAVTEEVSEGGRPIPRYSMRETDPETLKFLNDQLEKGEVVRAYKSFLEVPNEDGTVSLYPPMATKVSAEKKGGKRKMANAMAVGEWEKSVGNPNSRNIFRDKETGKWKYNLIKDNGDTVPADYDPYQHSSNVVLNDQFEQAYARPNLVTYEVVVPQSEMTSGFHYRAANDAGEIVEAALPVGEHPWKKGIVAGKLKNTDRKVYMTRWLMPVRKVENSEVAQMYKDILDREENPVAIPFNVVPPGLQEELEKIGVPIDYEGSGQYKYWQKNNPEKFPSGKPIAQAQSRFSIQGQPATPQQAQARYSIQDEQSNNWAPEFYSKMANTINEWTNGKGQPLPPKMSAQQVLGWLKGKGVKSEEIKWSGIVPYLEGKKTVTKEELQQVMAENEIKIETKVLGREVTKEGTYYEGMDPRDGGDFEIGDIDAVMDYIDELARDLGYEEGSLEPRPDPFDGWIRVVDKDTGKQVTVIQYHPAEVNDQTRWSDYTTPGGDNYREVLFKQPDLEYINDAMDVHWNGETGVLAHARIQDMYDSRGGQMLFIDEIQSDLHNAGAANGFVDAAQAKEAMELRELMYKQSEGLFGLDPKEETRMDELINKYAGEEEAKMRDLGLRRNIARLRRDLIADKMYDRIVENSNGKIQTSVEEVTAWINGILNGNPEPVFMGRVAPKQAIQTIVSSWSAEDADVARKAFELNQEYRKAADAYGAKLDKVKNVTPDVPFAGSSDTYHEYVMKHLLRLAAEGDYDSVAWTTADMQSKRWSDEFAEGYRIEYDQNLPKFMNKYGKQWGARVGQTQLNNGETVWSVKVTPEMKESVLRSGQPLFSIQDNTNDNPYPPNTLQHDLLEAARNGNLSEWVTQQMNAHEDALENAKIRPPVIPSKGFVPKVSEQEKAALEKRRQGLIQAKGAMKPSEKSNGFAMPRADETGNRFRRFLQNAGSAQELKVAQDQVEKFAFTDIASTYVPDSNKADLTWAKDVIHEDGLESAIKQFNREALKMEMPANVTKSLALGQQLLIETSRQGDMQNFLDVLSSLTLLSSQAGKSLQAFRMLKQSGPIGELYYVQKAVKQLNDRHSEKITAGKMAEITVPEDLSKAVLMASDEASRDKAMDDLIAGIAAQVPVTMMDKWNAWRYLAMLGNARTHVRNIIGNAVFVPLRFAKDLMAAGGEFIATKAGLMEEGDRRKSVSVSRELRDFAKQDAKIMQKELQGSGKYNPAREILDARKVLPGFLETLSRKNGQALEYEDWLFLSSAYQKALSQALAHTGYTIEEMQNGSNYDAVKALNNARRIAVEEAQKATYRDFNAAASMLNRIKRMESGKASDKVIGVLLEGVLPFTKTPINILRRGVEYSPIGIASSIFEAAAGVKNGNLDVAEFIDHLSAGLSGTAVAVLGYLLASLGYIRGKKDDKEEEFEKLQGYQDYSLQIGDVSATIDWAAPTALPLFTGAAVHSMIRDGESLEWKDAWDAMMMIAEPMMSLSMLDGLNNVLSSASYADDSQKLATVASSAFTSYLGQAFPTLLGQVARSVDGTRRSTYIDKNSPVPTAIQRFVQSSVQNKIPVWESQKIPYIDVWGREDTNDSKVLGALENFLSPSYINVVNTTDVDETLRELYDKTKENSVLPSQVGKYFSVNGERKDLTPDEYVSYAKDVGSTKYTLLAQLFADPRYMALTDEQKVKAISKIYSYATAVGKYHIDQNYDLHGQGKWMEEANAMPTEIQRFNRIWEYLEEYLSK